MRELNIEKITLVRILLEVIVLFLLSILLLIAFLVIWKLSKEIQLFNSEAKELVKNMAISEKDLEPRYLRSVQKAVTALNDQGERRKNQRNLFRQAGERIPIGLVICSESGEIIQANSFAASFIEGRHGDLLVGEAIRRQISAVLDGEPGSEKIEVVGPPPRVFDVSAFALKDSGVVAVIDDITEHQRSAVVRRDFVANVSHELKTPIGALALLAETMLGEQEPEVLRRLASRIQFESERAGEIIDDLLDLSKIESDLAMEYVEVDLTKVVSESLRRVESRSSASDVLFEVKSIDTLVVFGSYSQLVSAVHNLIDNAIKYSDSGEKVEVNLSCEEGVPTLSVKDLGIGIPDHEKDRIFERFYRIDRARSRETGGSGLGLSLVRNVIQNHGGEIELDSLEGKGSTFTIRFPQTGKP